MIKQVSPTTRNERMSHDEYVAFYTSTVAGDATRIPGLRKYFANAGLRAIDGGVPPFASVAEMYWDSVEEHRDAYLTDEWWAARAGHPKGIIGRFHFTVEEHAILDGDRGEPGSGIKYLAFLNRRDGQSRADFQKYWFDEHTKLALRLPGLQRYVASIGRHSFNGDSMFQDPMEPAPFDGVVEMWFPSVEAFDSAWRTDLWEQMDLDYYTNFAQGRMHQLVREKLMFDEYRGAHGATGEVIPATQ